VDIIKFPQFLRTKNFNLFDNSSVFSYMIVCCKISKNDQKKIKTYRSLTGLYVKVYISIFVHLLVLSIKKLLCLCRASW